MIHGMTIQELAQKVQENAQRRRDVVVDTRSTALAPGDGADTPPRLLVQGDPHDLTETAHGQLAQKLGVPKRYYDRMRQDAPDLLAENVNRWLRQEPKSVMVRAYRGNGSPAVARAILSDRYRRLDNDLVAAAALPVLAEPGSEMEVLSSQVTERSLYIQAVNHALEREVPRVGDVVRSGIVIGNSETGHGALSVRSMVYTLACSNGMIVGKALRRHHVGRQIDPGEELEQAIYSDEALEADDRAFALKVRDAVRACLTDVEAFDAVVHRLAEAATGEEIERPAPAVKVLSQRLDLTEDETDGILGHLAKGGDLSQYGAANAVTRYAEDVGDYDRAVELEEKGWQVIDLPADQWRTVARAAA